MKLHTLLQAIPLINLPLENPEITNIVNDNRKVSPGCLFICIKGHVFDGHTFAKDAALKGAAAILSEEDLEVGVPVIKVKDTTRAMAMLADVYFGQPTHKLQLIGITGTNGKTTTSYMIEKIFQDYERKTGLIGTINMKIGNSILETKNTTPDSLVFQSVFQEMVKEKVDVAIMEVSSHALVQGRVNGCDYDIAVFTNLSQDHLDYHHTMEEYRRAKGLLFSRLGHSYSERNPKYAVLNADDEVSDEYKNETAAHVITYGMDNSADFRALDIQLDGRGTSFTLQSPEGERMIKLNLIGKFNVYNVLAAIAVAYISNIPLDSIIYSVEGATGVPGRFEAVNGGQDYSVIVDYAHTPDSLENVLKTIQQFAKNASLRLWVVVVIGTHPNDH